MSPQLSLLHKLLSAIPACDITGSPMRWKSSFALLLAACVAHGEAPKPSAIPGLRFQISFPATAHADPITGRVFVILSRDIAHCGPADAVAATTEPCEPRLQVSRIGVPFFGRDVDSLKAGDSATIDDSDLGSPLAHLSDIPAGDYYVQAMVNVYSEFHRADGHTLWMHDDQWEGQRWQRSPGNLYSKAVKMHIDPAAGAIRLIADQVIPPVTVPADTEYVKHIKFKSELLSKFWGRPVYLGAVVLLPRDYDRTTIRYPIDYIQGHFSLEAPYRFDGQNEFSKAWMSDHFPRMIAVTLQHPNPYYDDSYLVNSPNVGPYDDALMQELIPAIEKQFRVITEPYARVVSGGSTGGWISAYLQIFHPTFFGGAWCSCPDAVTFSDVEGVNFYKDDNAFFKMYDWRPVPTINSRFTNGQAIQTSEQRNRYELVSGDHGRSGEQIDVWSAVWGPVSEDGYFKPAFDKSTGKIDKEVVAYWRDHWDLLEHLKRNWPTVGPELKDNLYFFAGDADTYFLNNSTMELDAWLKTTTAPHSEAQFMYGNLKPHCWQGPVTPAQRVIEIAQHIQRHKPEGADTPWWDYR
jgi:Putative esterase